MSSRLLFALPSLLLAGCCSTSTPVAPTAVTPTAATAATPPSASPAAPTETRQLLSLHETDATFTGLVKQPCRHRTSECPDRCDHGGTVAEFRVDAYRRYEKTGEYGDARTDVYRVRLQNSRGEARLDTALLKRIESLKVGDRVRLDWRHDYVTHAGASFPERPITRLDPVAQ
jgi:hypothetical protein